MKWFNVTKEFGFIQPINRGRDIFVQASAVQLAGLTALSERQKIHFDVVAHKNSGKIVAENLKALWGCDDLSGLGVKWRARINAHDPAG